MPQQQSIPPEAAECPIDYVTNVHYPPPNGATLWPLFSGLPTPCGALPMLGPDTIQERDSAKVRCRMPIIKGWRDRFRDPLTGRIYELDFVWVLASRWRGSELSASPGWRARRVGPFILAVRLTA